MTEYCDQQIDKDQHHRIWSVRGQLTPTMESPIPLDSLVLYPLRRKARCKATYSWGIVQAYDGTVYTIRPAAPVPCDPITAFETLNTATVSVAEQLVMPPVCMCDDTDESMRVDMSTRAAHVCDEQRMFRAYDIPHDKHWGAVHHTDLLLHTGATEVEANEALCSLPGRRVYDEIEPADFGATLTQSVFTMREIERGFGGERFYVARHELYDESDDVQCEGQGMTSSGRRLRCRDKFDPGTGAASAWKPRSRGVRPRFRVGETVMARWRHWGGEELYGATISEYRTCGRYVVDWDDGDERNREVNEEDIERCSEGGDQGPTITVPGKKRTRSEADGNEESVALDPRPRKHRDPRHGSTGGTTPCQGDDDTSTTLDRLMPLNDGFDEQSADSEPDDVHRPDTDTSARGTEIASEDSMPPGDVATGTCEPITDSEQARVLEHVLLTKRHECFFKLYGVHQNREATESQKRLLRKKCSQKKNGPADEEVSSATGVKQCVVRHVLLELRCRIAENGEDPATILEAATRFLKTTEPVTGTEEAPSSDTAHQTLSTIMRELESVRHQCEERGDALLSADNQLTAERAVTAALEQRVAAATAEVARLRRSEAATADFLWGPRSTCRISLRDRNVIPPRGARGQDPTGRFRWHRAKSCWEYHDRHGKRRTWFRIAQDDLMAHARARASTREHA